MLRERFSLSGGTLKTIAIISMAIDHFGAAILKPLQSITIDRYQSMHNMVCSLYPISRNIGRLAFPIFCFLLVEGFTHTHNRAKYAWRMFLFALLSEFPFDYALKNSVINTHYQNVYFTLLIGLLVLIGVQYFETRDVKTKYDPYLNLFMEFIISLAGLLLAKWMHTDYGYKGVFLIIVLYFLRSDRTIQAIFGAIAISWERIAPLAFIPVWLYNGKRGRQNKYFFYFFYPVHLLLFGFIRHFVL